MSKTENTPFLNPNGGSDEIPSYTRDLNRVPQGDNNLIYDIDENEIVSYVKQRRESIASVGPDKIPTAFSLTRTRSRTTDTDNWLHSVKLNSSFDVQDVLSNHQNQLNDEPETDYNTELKVLGKYSVPLIITFLLQYSLTVASVFSVGKLGSSELAAVSLASMTSNISGYAIIQGISTCLDTLCAQSYGQKDYRRVGLHFMRCNYLLLLLFIPIYSLWYFGSKSILISIIGDDQIELCTLASDYLSVLGLGVPGFILFENGKHYLQSQGIFHASTYVLAICAPINVCLNYLLVWDKVIGLGFVGAPLSVVITNYLMSTLLYLYIFYVDGSKCWPKESIFSLKFFYNWKKMIDLSIPGVFMVEAEWLAFEIITFTASRFGTDVLAAQSIVSTSCVLLYQIPFATSIAASTRIAWFIGAASKRSAKFATNTAIFVAFIGGIFTGVVLFTFRTPLAKLYTQDENVIQLASKVLIIGALYQVNDSLSCITNGILRGQGRQKIGGFLNLFAYYVIALPVALYLAIVMKMELVGLWLGMLVALFTLSLLQMYFVLSSDWDYIINECINDSIMDDGSIHIDSHSIVPSMTSNQVI